MPRAYWTWADDTSRHPELVTMDLWEQAPAIGAERGNVRDAENPAPTSQRRPVYPLRSRISCNTCKRRMHGLSRQGRTGARQDEGQVTTWPPSPAPRLGSSRPCSTPPSTGTSTAATPPTDLFADLMTAAMAAKTADKAPSA